MFLTNIAVFFDSAKNLNPKDKERVVEYLEDKVKQEIANKLIFLDFSKNTEKVYRAQHQKDLGEATRLISSTKINDIRITGFASPEGPESKGPATIQPGAVDVENIELAEKRAVDMSLRLKEALTKMGLDSTAVADIKAEELQFNNDELRELDVLAIKSGIKGEAETGRIYDLIKDYNLNKFADNAELQTELNKIVGSKRQVQIEIDFENEQRKKVVVPLPLGLLPLLLLRHRKLESEPKPTGPQKLEVGPKPREIFPDAVVDFTKDLENNDQDFVERFRRVEESLSISNREGIEERVIIDDIDAFMDDPEAIRRGVDYRAMVGELNQVRPRYENDEKFQQAVSHVLLTRWKEHDQNLRRELGIESDDGLDYHRSDKQVLWSRFHARELIELAKHDPHQLDMLLDARITALEARKMMRSEDSTANHEFKIEIEERHATSEAYHKGAETHRSGFEEWGKRQQEAASQANKAKEKTAESKVGDRLAELENAMKQKAAEMKGLDSATSAHREKQEQWDLLRKEYLALEIPETREKQEVKSPEDKNALQQRFGEIKQEILRKAREMSAAKERVEAARKLGDKTPFLENQYIEAQKAWAEADKEYNELESKLKPQEAGKQEAVAQETKKTLWSSENMDSWTFGAGERLNPAKVEMKKNISESDSEKESWLNKERREKIWGWTKERLKGLATFGFWEVHRAEQFRSAKKKVGKELSKKSETVRRTENLSLEDAHDEALRIQANLALEGKPGGKGATSEDYERLSNAISREKHIENQIYVSYLVKNAESTLRERLKKYKNEFGKNVLDETKIKEAMAELKGKLLSLENGALEADTKDFSKVIKDKLDPKYWRRYIYGGAEAALGFAGWSWLSGKAASWWYGGGEAAKAMGGAEAGKAASSVAEALPEEMPMDQHIWGTVKEYLTQNGVPNPTDQQIMEGSKIIAHDNGIGVKIWGVDGAPLDTNMQQGYLLKFGGLVKKIAWLKTLG